MKEESLQSPNDRRLIQEDDLPLIREEDLVASTKPDKYTRMSFFEGGAPGQVFMVDWAGIKYGTDDKGHAAAVILSVLLLILLGGVVVLGSIFDRSWIPAALQILGPAFTFVAGVAVGKSMDDK